MATWEDIETAPKDGSWFLAVNTLNDWGRWTAAVIKYSDNQFVVAHNDVADFTPKFWRRLPRPPKNKIWQEQP